MTVMNKAEAWIWTGCIMKQTQQHNTTTTTTHTLKASSTFHENLILGYTLEQFVVLRVVLADSLCRGTGQSHEQLLGGPACLHGTGTTGHSAAAGHSAGRRHHPLPQRTRALHQAQHVGTVHTHTLAHIQGLEQAAARHTLFPCRRSVQGGDGSLPRCIYLCSTCTNTHTHTPGSNVYTYTHLHTHTMESQQQCLSLQAPSYRNHKALFLSLKYTSSDCTLCSWHPPSPSPSSTHTQTHTLCPSSLWAVPNSLWHTHTHTHTWSSSLFSVEIPFPVFIPPLPPSVCGVGLWHKVPLKPNLVFLPPWTHKTSHSSSCFPQTPEISATKPVFPLSSPLSSISSIFPSPHVDSLCCLMSAAPVFVLLLIAGAGAAPVLRDMELTVGYSTAQGSITNGGKPGDNADWINIHWRIH